VEPVQQRRPALPGGHAGGRLLPAAPADRRPDRPQPGVDVPRPRAGDDGPCAADQPADVRADPAADGGRAGQRGGGAERGGGVGLWRLHDRLSTAATGPAGSGVLGAADSAGRARGYGAGAAAPRLADPERPGPGSERAGRASADQLVSGLAGRRLSGLARVPAPLVLDGLSGRRGADCVAGGGAGGGAAPSGGGIPATHHAHCLRL